MFLEYYLEINSLNHIFLLYRTDPQVEIKIRILHKEAAIVSKMQTPAIRALLGARAYP
jgi:hypothetical protein